MAKEAKPSIRHQPWVMSPWRRCWNRPAIPTWPAAVVPSPHMGRSHINSTIAFVALHVESACPLHWNVLKTPLGVPHLAASEPGLARFLAGRTRWWNNSIYTTSGMSLTWAMVVVVIIQYRHLIPAPVDQTSAIAWLYKHPWITCQK